MAGHVAGKAQHGAVAAHHDGQIALGAHLLVGEGGVVGDAGVLGGLAFQGNIQSLRGHEFGNLLEYRADAAGLMLAHDGRMSERRLRRRHDHAQNYTTAM